MGPGPASFRAPVPSNAASSQKASAPSPAAMNRCGTRPRHDVHHFVVNRSASDSFPAVNFGFEYVSTSHVNPCEQPNSCCAGGGDGVTIGIFLALLWVGANWSLVNLPANDFAEDLSEEGKRTKSLGQVDRQVPTFAVCIQNACWPVSSFSPGTSRRKQRGDQIG